MAKKNKNNVDETINNDVKNADGISSKSKKGKKDKSSKSKTKGILTVLLLFILIASFIGYIFMFNGFGLRDGVLRPILEKTPIISNYLPPVESNSQRLSDLVLENNELESENEVLKQQVENATKIAENSADEIERLKLIEQQQTDFVAMKEEFDKNFAEMTSEDFIKYYEAMYPDVAEEAYSELISDKYSKEEVDEYIATFQTMDGENIAAILEEMMNTDMELVVLIMQNLDNQLAGETLAAMDPENAAQVAKLMSPDVIN